jgi:hypothetical protein
MSGNQTKEQQVFSPQRPVVKSQVLPTQPLGNLGSKDDRQKSSAVCYGVVQRCAIV